MRDPAHDTDADPELGRGFTFMVIFGPLGFFSVYLLAVMMPGARTQLGAALLSVIGIVSYVGLSMLGTRWFDKHRRR